MSAARDTGPIQLPAGNGYDQHRALIQDFMRRQEGHNEAVITRLDNVAARLTTLETRGSTTERSFDKFVSPAVAAFVGGLVALFLRKLGM